MTKAGIAPAFLISLFAPLFTLFPKRKSGKKKNCYRINSYSMIAPKTAAFRDSAQPGMGRR